MATPFARPAISVIPKTAPGWLSNSGAWTFSGVRSQVEQEKKKIERSNREKKKTARPWHFFFFATKTSDFQPWRKSDMQTVRRIIWYLVLAMIGSRRYHALKRLESTGSVANSMEKASACRLPLSGGFFSTLRTHGHSPHSCLYRALAYISCPGQIQICSTRRLALVISANISCKAAANRTLAQATFFKGSPSAAL